MLLSLFLCALPSFALADRLHLVGGGSLDVLDWWVEGETLYYETDAGVIGIPERSVLSVEETETSTLPRLSADSRSPERNEPKKGGGEATATTKRAVVQRRWDPAEVDSAIERLEVEAQRAGGTAQKEKLETGLANLLVIRARLFREANENALAADSYDRALRYRNDHLLARVELGWLELEVDRVEYARAQVETGLALHPGEPHLLALRGELFYRDNRLRDALQDLEEAHSKLPNDTAIKRRLEKVRRDLAAESRYIRSNSAHFTLSYDGDRDEAIGALLLDQLEQSWSDLTSELEVVVMQPITVILYTRREFHETTGTGREVAGLFDGKVRLPIGGVTRITPGLTRLIRHELTHALLHVKGAGRVPRWLHEGLAQWMEPRDVDTVDPALSLARSRGKRIRIEPFSYPTALSFVAFLEKEYGRSRLLWLVELLAERQEIGRAFDRAFGLSLGEAVAEWNRSL